MGDAHNGTADGDCAVCCRASMAVPCCCWRADQKSKFDEVVEDKGVKILIDPAALMHVLGTRMDFIDDKLK